MKRRRAAVIAAREPPATAVASPNIYGSPEGRCGGCGRLIAARKAAQLRRWRRPPAQPLGGIELRCGDERCRRRAARYFGRRALAAPAAGGRHCRRLSDELISPSPGSCRARERSSGFDNGRITFGSSLDTNVVFYLTLIFVLS